METNVLKPQRLHGAFGNLFIKAWTLQYLHRFHYFSLFSNSVQVLNYLIVIGHRTFDLLVRVYCTNHWTTNTTADLKTIPFLSIRNQYRSCRGRCHWGQEASVRHLGQRGQRGLEDGLDRNYRKDSG